MSSAHDDLGALWSRVTQAAAQARTELTPEQRAAAIAAAAREFACADDVLVSVLSASCGLSEPMVRWALSSTFSIFSETALLELLATAHDRRQPAPCAAVLAGNVLTAAARPMLLPLLVGAPVVVKAASRDDALPHALALALCRAHPLLGATCGVATFEHHDTARLDALVAGARSVQVLGSDEAVAALRVRATGKRFVGRGHGLGLGLVTAGMSASALQDAARTLALDVVAYDQRGCLSPQAIFVVCGRDHEHLRAHAFARALFGALGELQERMPRGDLPAESAAAQVQWRGVAQARGTLHAASTHAVSIEAALPMRASPGYRNIAVHPVQNVRALAQTLARLAPHLKALGVAGAMHDDEQAIVDAHAPYVCAAGAMQMPPLHARLDGLDPLAGLIENDPK